MLCSFFVAFCFMYVYMHLFECLILIPCCLLVGQKVADVIQVYENSEGRVLNIMPSGMGVHDESGATTAVSSYQPQHSVSAVQQILSPLQFIHAQPGSTGWMTPYPMMMLPGSSVPQSLLLQPNGTTSGMFATADGQVFVAPIGDASGNTLMPVDVSGCV
jgi:hypothetical protein